MDISTTATRCTVHSKHSRGVPRYCGQSVCRSSFSQTHDWEVYAGRVRWIWLSGKGNKSFGFAWICARHEFWNQVCRDKASGSHQNSTGRVCWERCRSNDFTSTTMRFVLPKLFPPVLPSQTCFTVLTCFGFWNTRVMHGCGTCRRCRLLRESFARPGLGGFVLLDHRTESERCFWFETWTIARKCAWTGCCSVSGQKQVHPKASTSRSKFRSSALLVCLSRFVIVLTMNARRFQRTHPLSGMGSSLDASKDIGLGGTDLAFTCQNQ